MTSREMEYHIGDTYVSLYEDDDGSFRVTRTTEAGSIHIAGQVLEREDATHLFNKEVQRLTRVWELKEGL